jgi:hypothetical protein
LVSVFHVLIMQPTQQIISTFISHTIASVLLVPIAKEVGSNLPGHHQNLLIFITGLICSAGMGMPVSGFPNQTASVPIQLFTCCVTHTQGPLILSVFLVLQSKMSLANSIFQMSTFWRTGFQLV